MVFPKQRLSGALFFVAAVQFVLFLIISEALYEGYSTSANYVSDLGIGPSSVVFNSSVFTLGLLTGIGAYFLKNAAKLRTTRLLLFLMAAGAMGVGIFTKNFTMAHGMVSSAACFFGGLTAVVSAFALERPSSWISAALGVMTLGALALFSSGMVASGSMTSTVAYDSFFYLGLGPGGMERIIIYPALTWVTLFGGQLITQRDS